MIKKKIKWILHKINKMLKRIPVVRNGLVYSYHYARRILFGFVRMVTGYKKGMLTNGVRITPKGENCYFGYYDKSVFSSDGEFYLYHGLNGKKSPRRGEQAKIYLSNLKGMRRVLGTTMAWNLQQGAMLRWITDELVAWNDFDTNRGIYVSVFYDLNTGNKRIIDTPLYDVSDDGKCGLSIDFERLNYDAEGYGYIQQGRVEFENDSYISYVDLETREEKNIITIKQLCERFPIRTDASFAYFNHLEFNPRGDRFIFIFRYIVDGKRISRLFSSDVCGERIHLLADEEMVSHCTWLDDNHITLWCRIDGVDNYYVIEDCPNAKARRVGYNTPNEDGHPTYSADKKYLITDTYPDKAEYRHLILYDCVNDKSVDIARLYAPILLHGSRRCDFHPRWYPDMQRIIIDSAHEGYRGMYMIDTAQR